jgi:uncharacterized protein (TIGR02598 family)
MRRTPQARKPRTPAFRFSHQQSRERGFSLVEITMAIGIVAFAFIAIFGLVPVGLASFRSALDTSVRAQIAQRLVFDAQQADVRKLLSATRQPDRYFDDEGTEVAAESSIYTAALRVLPQTELPGGISPNLLTVQVMIAHNPGQVADPFREDSKLQTTTHSAFIARATK